MKTLEKISLIAFKYFFIITKPMMTKIGFFLWCLFFQIIRLNFSKETAPHLLFFFFIFIAIFELLWFIFIGKHISNMNKNCVEGIEEINEKLNKN